MPLIDSHSHIDFDDFNTDRGEVIQRAVESGVSNIIVSATTAERWPLIRALCKDYPEICHPAYGLHPLFMASHQQDIDYGVEKLKQWFQQNRAIAVGEIGLDYFIDVNESDKHDQLKLFIAQLDIANDLNLPVIIHARKSLDIVLKYLRRYKNLRGLIHSFSGSEQQAKQLIDLGFYLSFGGPITYSRATRLHTLIKALPLDNIVVETDSPDQPASTHYNQRNEPAFVIEVIQKIAELKQTDIDSVKKLTTLNARNLFDFKSC